MTCSKDEHYQAYAIMSVLLQACGTPEKHVRCEVCKKDLTLMFMEDDMNE